MSVAPLPASPSGPAGHGSVTGERRMRADARANRDRLLSAARAAFTGPERTVALEDIAARAGVGVGTLYRHFPTREALVEAVYAAELDDVVLDAQLLLDQHPPDVALRAWMRRYAEFVATKRGMADVLRAGWAAGRAATPSTRDRITSAIGAVLHAGAAAGTLRADVAAEDVTALLLGVFLSTATDDGPHRVEQLLDLIVDALRNARADGQPSSSRVAHSNSVST